MKSIILDDSKSPPVCSGLTELSFDEMAGTCGGGYYAYHAYRFWSGVYDGFSAGFGSWVDHGFLK